MSAIPLNIQKLTDLFQETKPQPFHSYLILWYCDMGSSYAGKAEAKKVLRTSALFELLVKLPLCPV